MATVVTTSDGTCCCGGPACQCGADGTWCVDFTRASGYDPTFDTYLASVGLSGPQVLPYVSACNWGNGLTGNSSLTLNIGGGGVVGIGVGAFLVGNGASYQWSFPVASWGCVSDLVPKTNNWGAWSWPGQIRVYRGTCLVPEEPPGPCSCADTGSVTLEIVGGETGYAGTHVLPKTGTCIWSLNLGGSVVLEFYNSSGYWYAILYNPYPTVKVIWRSDFNGSCLTMEAFSTTYADPGTLAVTPPGFAGARIIGSSPAVTTLDMLPCKYRGGPTGDTVPCESCTGSVRLKLFKCDLYGLCTIDRKVEGVQMCVGCGDRDPGLEVKP